MHKTYTKQAQKDLTLDGKTKRAKVKTVKIKREESSRDNTLGH